MQQSQALGWVPREEVGVTESLGRLAEKGP